jgi:hypothetical protein
MALEQFPDLEKIRHFPRRQALNRDPAIWHQADEPFRGEPAKSLAKGAAAVGDFLGQVADHEPLPRREAAADDPLPNRIGNGVNGFAMPVPFGGRCTGPRV